MRDVPDTLREIVARLDSLDEGLTIYCRAPWHLDAECVLLPSDEDANVDEARAVAEGFTYFLEVFVAREVLEALPPDASVADRARIVLYYARYDAYPESPDVEHPPPALPWRDLPLPLGVLAVDAPIDDVRRKAERGGYAVFVLHGSIVDRPTLESALVETFSLPVDVEVESALEIRLSKLPALKIAIVWPGSTETAIRAPEVHTSALALFRRISERLWALQDHPKQVTLVVERT